MTEQTDYNCPLCNGEVEVQEVDGHWMKLYCESCEKSIERPTVDDMNGVSLGDLNDITQFTD